MWTLIEWGGFPIWFVLGLRVPVRWCCARYTCARPTAASWVW